MTADIQARVAHLAPGDPVSVAIRFAPEVGAVRRIESLEVALARPDGTTQRAPATPPSAGGSSTVIDLTAGGGLDLSLAGRYRLALSGVADGRPFASRSIEIEVMGDGRLPLAEIERRARRELERRRPGVIPDSAVVIEGPGGDREVRFAAGAAAALVRLSPAGTVLAVETGPPP